MRGVAVSWPAERAAYPIVTVVALAGCAWMLEAGFAPVVAAYLPIAAAIACILAHEALLPERDNWRPDAGEVATDLGFLVVVHMLLPRFLGIGAAFAAAALCPAGLRVDGLWPDHWPIAGQVVLLAIAAELPRYWLHRLEHRSGLLWRFHAVHHAPSRLYALNVGRFHPLDRALQWSVEVLPFIALGVTPEVLALYFVFYAVTGFYQHSNCRLRLGTLNWIIAGPELHRWHHSALPRESNSNYGNKLIFWDLVFGTRFLPRGRSVGRLGLLDPAYPTGFLAQLAAPFVRTGSAP